MKNAKICKEVVNVVLIYFSHSQGNNKQTKPKGETTMKNLFKALSTSNHTDQSTKGVKTMKKLSRIKNGIIAGILSAATIFSAGAATVTSASAAEICSVTSVNYNGNTIFYGSIIFFVGLTMPRYRFSMPSVSLDMNPKQCFRGSIPTATNSRTARPRHRSIAWESCQGQALTGGWIVPLRLGI